MSAIEYQPRDVAYAEGFHEGRRWAERDIADHGGYTTLLNEGVPTLDEGGDAYEVGCRRGYRDTWARYDAGTLTWEEFELAPRRGCETTTAIPTNHKGE